MRGEFVIIKKLNDSEFLHVNHVTVYSKEKDKNEKFRLAKVFQNGMVLQRAPERANIFGFGPLGTFVTVTIIKNGERHDMGNVTVAVESCLKGTWSLNIGAWDAGSDYSIEITNSGQGIQAQTIWLESVSFGEVWFCAGQSNMGQPLYAIRNKTAEIEKAKTPKPQNPKTPWVKFA